MLGLPAQIIFCDKQKAAVCAFEVALLAVPKVNETLLLTVDSLKIVACSYKDGTHFDCAKVIAIQQEVDLQGDSDPEKQVDRPVSKLLVSVVPAQSSAYKKAIAKIKKGKKPKSKKK